MLEKIQFRPDQVNPLFHGSGGSIIHRLLEKYIFVWTDCIHMINITDYIVALTIDSTWQNLALVSFAWSIVVTQFYLPLFLEEC